MLDDVDPDALRWQGEHSRFLAENRPDVLTALQASGDLDDYLTSIGETASERLSHAMRELRNDKEHQKLPYLERVRALQNRQQETEEQIRHDLILQPTGTRRARLDRSDIRFF
jgi:Transposon-encoded protein TnpV